MKEETLYLYLNKELDKNELKKVEEWIELNPEEYQKIKTIWKNTQINTSDFKPDTSGMWNNILKEVENPDHNMKVKKISLYKSLLKYAAVFILCFGLVSFYAHWKRNQIEWHEYAANSTKTENISLPDGSTITLNKDSRLLYKKQFLAKNREVKLLGEAFFDVKRNPKKPFVINLNNTVVRVLGTSFNVDASDSTGKVFVSVESGKVMFYSKQDETNKVYLTAGDKGIYLTGNLKIQKTKNQNLNYTAWKTGILLFKNNSLNEICEVLSKYYNIKFSIDNPELNEQKLTARYQNKSLHEVLELLKISLDIQYFQKDDEIILHSN